jgi:hypothetical protein
VEGKFVFFLRGKKAKGKRGERGREKRKGEKKGEKHLNTNIHPFVLF